MDVGKLGERKLSELTEKEKTAFEFSNVEKTIHRATLTGNSGLKYFMANPDPGIHDPGYLIRIRIRIRILHIVKKPSRSVSLCGKKI